MICFLLHLPSACKMKIVSIACFALLASVQSLHAAAPRTEYVAPNLREYVNNCTIWEQPYVLGGTEAEEGQIPFQVAITSSNTSQPRGFCGGTLISPSVVMTAAHCIYNYTKFEVILGTLRALDPNSANRVTFKTTEKVIHEDFDFEYGLNNDIGLLFLPEPVDLNPSIQPILLPSLRDVSDTFVGHVATTSGWGKIDDDPSLFINDDLLWVDVEVINNAECEWAFGANYMPPTKMCVFTAGGTKGPCNGDSGGPMFLTNSAGEQIIVGIVSFGASVGCTCGYPDVYTRVTSFLDWIASHGGPAVRP